MRNINNSTTEGDIRGISMDRIIEKAMSSKNAVLLTGDHGTKDSRNEKTRSFLKLLLNKWVAGASPKQIAQQLGQPEKIIYGALKDVEQAILAIIDESGIEYHGTKKQI